MQLDRGVPTALAHRFSADPALLERLLRSGQLRRAPAAPEATPDVGERPLSSGAPPLDRLLGGGLFRGELCELVGPPSAGGTALLLSALGAAARAGEACALVDLDDAFDPRGAARGGLPLQRLLWVRPATLRQALRAAELLLQARFGLVALDLGTAEPAAAGERGGARRGDPTAPRPPSRTVSDSSWARLARAAELQRGALLVRTGRAQAGSFAAALVELRRAPALWAGAPGTPGRLLCGAQARASVGRSRHAPPSPPLGLRFEWSG